MMEHYVRQLLGTFCLEMTMASYQKQHNNDNDRNAIQQRKSKIFRKEMRKQPMTTSELLTSLEMSSTAMLIECEIIHTK